MEFKVRICKFGEPTPGGHVYTRESVEKLIEMIYKGQALVIDGRTTDLSFPEMSFREFASKLHELPITNKFGKITGYEVEADTFSIYIRPADNVDCSELTKFTVANPNHNLQTSNSGPFGVMAKGTKSTTSTGEYIFEVAELLHVNYIGFKQS